MLRNIIGTKEGCVQERTHPVCSHYFWPVNKHHRDLHGGSRYGAALLLLLHCSAVTRASHVTSCVQQHSQFNSTHRLSTLLNQCLITRMTSSANYCPPPSTLRPHPPALLLRRLFLWCCLLRRWLAISGCSFVWSSVILVSSPGMLIITIIQQHSEIPFTAYLCLCDQNSLSVLLKLPTSENMVHSDCMSARVCLFNKLRLKCFKV